MESCHPRKVDAENDFNWLAAANHEDQDPEIAQLGKCRFNTNKENREAVADVSLG